MQSCVYFYLHKRHRHTVLLYFFFFNDTAPTDIYTLSLHDALPIWEIRHSIATDANGTPIDHAPRLYVSMGDRKSTRLNSSHRCNSYAVFCLKKKKIACVLQCIFETSNFISSNSHKR